MRYEGVRRLARLDKGRGDAQHPLEAGSGGNADPWRKGSVGAGNRSRAEQGSSPERLIQKWFSYFVQRHMFATAVSELTMENA
jgi:hypothetical protein